MTVKDKVSESKVTEKPLVTFVLFAYNQEEYIREAVEGAFAQTYHPLEIILSDDRSSDQTFSIMKQMATEYSGPHNVQVRQSPSNRGTFNHLLEVARSASGKLLILAAGDDISKPDRTSKIVDSWLETSAFGISSLFDLIDAKGRLLETRLRGSGNKELLRWFPSGSDPRHIHGATSAYDAEIFKHLEYSTRPILSEDSVCSFLLLIRDLRRVCIEDSLVKYRQHEAALANAISARDSRRSIEDFERKIAGMASSYIALCDYCDALISEHQVADPGLSSRIRDTAHFSRIRSRWIAANALGRIALALSCRSWREIRFMAPRIVGLDLFVSARFMLRKLWRAK